MKSMLFISMCAGLLLCAGALAQESYPNRPVRFIAGSTPGSVTDVMARLLAAELQAVWKQSVVVENRAGAGTMIAGEMVAKAVPDGYTLLVTTNAHTMNPALRKDMRFDVVKDFTPIAMIASAPNMLVVRADSPLKDVKAYVAAAKEKPGEMTYGTAGIGTTTHFGGEYFGYLVGVKFNHIPFKGSNESVESVIAGRIDSSWSGVNSALPFIKGGRLRGLAIASDKRAASLPDVPTFAELGIDKMISGTWFGVLAPANLPKPIATKLAADIMRLVASPEVRQKIMNLGADPVAMELDVFTTQMKNDVAANIELARTAGIKAE